LFSISFCIAVFIIRLWEENVKVGEGLILSPAQGRVPYFRVFAQSKRPIVDSAFLRSGPRSAVHGLQSLGWCE
jgi:hypothetical protein